MNPSFMISICTFLIAMSGFIFLRKKRRMQPKYTCAICGYKHFEKFNFKKFMKTALKVTFLSFVGITSFIGATSLYNYLSGGIYDVQDVLFSFGGLYATPLNFFSSFESDINPELHKIALNLTKDCRDDYCRSRVIYEFLQTFDYEIGKDLNPMDIYNEREGDCDKLSYLYISLLKSLKIKAMLQCTIVDEEGHCYTIIHLKDKKILADITQNNWEEYS